MEASKTAKKCQGTFLRNLSLNFSQVLGGPDSIRFGYGLGGEAVRAVPVVSSNGFSGEAGFHSRCNLTRRYG